MIDYESHIVPDESWVGDGQRSGVEPLNAFLARTPRLAVAFSGGCDSSYLLAAARSAGCETAAYMVRTEFQPAFEFEDALAVAGRLGASLKVIDISMLGDRLEGAEERHAICANGPDRCYLCKKLIFSTIWKHARADGFEVVADGTNASDDPARRPGFRALSDLGVVSPLRRSGMSKADVRRGLAEYERAFGLPEGALMSSKPSFPCLAVYVPENEEITRMSLDAAARKRGV